MRIRICAMGAAAVLALCTACGSQPIPRVAVAGTTIALFLPSQFKPGFGRVIEGDPSQAKYTDVNDTAFVGYGSTSLPEDPQRGEVIFELVDTNLDSLSPKVFLDRRFVTRVAIDEATPGSLKQGIGFRAGQIIALVDIPDDSTLSGDYRILVTRHRRKQSTQEFELLSTTTKSGGVTTTWNGWGHNTTPDPPDEGIPIRIIQDSGGGGEVFTERFGWDEVAGAFYREALEEAEELADITPSPTFLLTVDDGTDKPAAWQLDLTYPRKKLLIRGVELFRDAPSNALVTYSLNQTAPPVSCGASDETVTIQLLDPDRKAWGVRVAYELENFTDTCGGRAGAADFSISNVAAYDENGDPMTGIVTALYEFDR